MIDSREFFDLMSELISRTGIRPLYDIHNVEPPLMLTLYESMNVCLYKQRSLLFISITHYNSWPDFKFEWIWDIEEYKDFLCKHNVSNSEIQMIKGFMIMYGGCFKEQYNLR